MIKIKNAAYTVIGMGGTVQHILNEDQVANIIDDALRERSIIADIEVKNEIKRKI